MTDSDKLWDLVHNGADDDLRTWRLHYDSSIACSRSQPACNKFELVSPILAGETGLTQIRNVLMALTRHKVDIKVNKSMGFHVHVEVRGMRQNQLNMICQNFVKYEAVFDSLVPPSRRNGSPESDLYFQSNRNAMGYSSNHERHQALAACRDIRSLANEMNPAGRYYKLNLQNLVSDQRPRPTLEFRQHSATADFSKISNWVRLCVGLVRNSASLPPPACFRGHETLQYETEHLFHHVIKDPELQDFFLKRQQEVQHLTEDPCCDACRDGGRCTKLASIFYGFVG